MIPYYSDERITIYHADCVEVALPHFDALVTDPPFYLPARISSVRKSWPRTVSETAVMDSYFRGAFAKLLTPLRRTGAFYSFCDSTSYAVFLAGLYGAFDRTHCLVWDKGSGGLGNGWRHSHELILHGAYEQTVYAEAFRRDVLAVGRVESEDREHASAKPVSLIERLLSAHPVGLVVDPFMGSGTTLVAAKNLGWKAIGIEVEERYCEVAAQRLGQQVMPLGEVSA